MSEIDSGVQSGLTGIEQRERLGLTEHIGINRSDIPQTGEAVGGANGRAPVPRLNWLVIPVLGKGVEKGLESQRPAFPGEHSGDRKPQFQVGSRLKSDVRSPQIRLRVHRMDPVAVELEGRPQLQVAVPPQSAEKTGDLHRAQQS